MAINTSIKIDGSWKAGAPYVKVNGVWKAATAAYVKVNGAWKECVSSTTTYNTYCFGEYPGGKEVGTAWGGVSNPSDTDFEYDQTSQEPWVGTTQHCLLARITDNGDYVKASISKGEIFYIVFLSAPLNGKSQTIWDCIVHFRDGTAIFYEPNSYMNYTLFTYDGTYIKGYS